MSRIALFAAAISMAWVLPAAAHAPGQPGHAAAHVPGYPAKTVRVVLPFPAGGTTDVLARLLSQKMSESWGKPVIVDNRPGAGGAIAAELAARALPDGHTVFLGTIGDMAVNPSLMAKLRYDPEKDFSPVGLLGVTPLVLVVHPSLSIRSVGELIDAARAKPGWLSYLSVGEGSSQHLAGEMFRKLTRTEIVHVPYNGGAPQVTALLAGQEPQFGFVVLATALPHIRQGKLQALAISTGKRTRLLPDVPTLQEAGLQGFDIAPWFGTFVPVGTSREIVNFLSAENARIVRSPEVSGQLANLGIEETLSSPEELSHYLLAEIAKFRKLIEEAGIAKK
ncbi:MAG: Bug family tripartite tricarboxylate transporter substrate binding protein [Burkholderiaceae bacterium]